MANTISANGNEYDALFDPEIYLRKFYSNPSQSDEGMVFLFRGLHQAFVEGNLRGKRLLDIGTGPSICSVISAIPHFEEIYLSDFLDANRTYLRKWLDGKVDHSFQPFFEYFIKLEANQLPWSGREDELRSKVKDILTCDLLQSDILSVGNIGQFDAITSTLCLEVAAKDIACYGEICKKIGALVKDGGHVVLVGGLDQTFWIFEGHRFYTLKISKDELIDCWQNAGFAIASWQEHKGPPVDENPFSDYGSVFVLVARKNES